jgi:hypothetical protein
MLAMIVKTQNSDWNEANVTRSLLWQVRRLRAGAGLVVGG